MKYIFRYSLLSNFPNEENKISEEQLSQALQSVRFEFERYELSYLQELCLNCVDKFLNKPQQKVSSVIEDAFNNSNRAVPEYNAKQLQNIWQQQKVNVYRSIISNSCRSSCIYKDIEWSVKNVIMRKVQSQGKGNNIMTRLKINCVENSSYQQCSNKGSLIVNLSKKGVQRMYNSLQDCQNAINQVLLSEQ